MDRSCDGDIPPSVAVFFKSVHATILYHKALERFDNFTREAFERRLRKRGFVARQFEYELVKERDGEAPKDTLVSIDVDMYIDNSFYKLVRMELLSILHRFLGRDAAVKVIGDCSGNSVFLTLRISAEAMLLLYRFAIIVPGFLAGIGIIEVQALGRLVALNVWPPSTNVASSQEEGEFDAALKASPELLKALEAHGLVPHDCNTETSTRDSILRECARNALLDDEKMDKLIAVLQDQFTELQPVGRSSDSANTPVEKYDSEMASAAIEQSSQFSPVTRQQIAFNVGVTSHVWYDKAPDSMSDAPDDKSPDTIQSADSVSVVQLPHSQDESQTTDSIAEDPESLPKENPSKAFFRQYPIYGDTAEVDRFSVSERVSDSGLAESYARRDTLSSIGNTLPEYPASLPGSQFLPDQLGITESPGLTRDTITAALDAAKRDYPTVREVFVEIYHARKELLEATTSNSALESEIDKLKKQMKSVQLGITRVLTEPDVGSLAHSSHDFQDPFKDHLHSILAELSIQDDTQAAAQDNSKAATIIVCHHTAMQEPLPAIKADDDPGLAEMSPKQKSEEVNSPRHQNVGPHRRMESGEGDTATEDKSETAPITVMCATHTQEPVQATKLEGTAMAEDDPDLAAMSSAQKSEEDMVTAGDDHPSDDELVNATNLNVYLLGKEGTGKSTFAASFTATWFHKLFRRENQRDIGVRDLASRTKGMEITKYSYDNGLTLQMRDLGGTGDLFPFHTVLLSKQSFPSLMLIFVDGTDQIDTIEKDVIYSTKGLICTMTGERRIPMLVVATRLDRMTSKDIDRLEAVFGRVMLAFKEHIEYIGAVCLDARKSASAKMEMMRERIFREAQRLLAGAPKQPRALENISGIIEKLRTSLKEPFTTQVKFLQALKSALQSEPIPPGQQTKLTEKAMQLMISLGEIITYEIGEHSLVVTRPQLLPHIFALFVAPLHYPGAHVPFVDGIASLPDVLDTILTVAPAPDDSMPILRMVAQSGLILLQGDKVILPSKLPASKRPLGSWQHSTSPMIYAGICYECMNHTWFSSVVAGCLQTHISEYFKTAHGVKSTVYRDYVAVEARGSKVEGCIVFAPNKVQAYILVKGPDDQLHDAYFLLLLLQRECNKIIQRVSPGTSTELKVVSSQSIVKQLQTDIAVIVLDCYNTDDVEGREHDQDILSSKSGFWDTAGALLHMPMDHCKLLSRNRRLELVGVLDQIDDPVKLAKTIELRESMISSLENRNASDDVAGNVLLEMYQSLGYQQTLSRLHRLLESGMGHVSGVVKACAIIDSELMQLSESLPDIFVSRSPLQSRDKESQLLSDSPTLASRPSDPFATATFLSEIYDWFLRWDPTELRRLVQQQGLLQWRQVQELQRTAKTQSPLQHNRNLLDICMTAGRVAYISLCKIVKEKNCNDEMLEKMNSLLEPAERV
eukprot:scpid19201/ scgid33418/ 